MQMCPGDPPRCANFSEQFPNSHFLARFDVDRTQVAKQTDIALSMIKDYRVAVEMGGW